MDQIHLNPTHIDINTLTTQAPHTRDTATVLREHIDTDPNLIRLGKKVLLERDTNQLDTFLYAESFTAFTDEGDMLTLARLHNDHTGKLWTIGIWWKHEDGTRAPKDFLKHRFATKDDAVAALVMRYRAAEPQLF